MYKIPPYTFVYTSTMSYLVWTFGRMSDMHEKELKIEQEYWNIAYDKKKHSSIIENIRAHLYTKIQKINGKKRRYLISAFDWKKINIFIK